MAEYGLLGKTLNHSYSPEIHAFFGNDNYELIELQPEELELFFKKREFKGINVTIPYKKDALKYCDEISPIAKRCGSVNTIIKRDDGTLYGDNTDYYGFMYLIKRSRVNISGKQCLILGSGGAASAVREALIDSGALRVLHVTRNGNPNYTNIYNHVDTDIIVNATPVGMYPNCFESLINMPRFQRLTAVYDLIYNPARTKFVVDAMREYCAAFSGLPMLVAQAAKSHELFLGVNVSDEKIEQCISKIEFEKRNILLIGMPGCGKTTIGRELAKRLGRDLIDLDEEIEKKTGRTPEDIIRKDGETKFREIETEVLKEFSILSSKIISCGGGVISPKANRFIMKMNSTVIWIQRAEELLATDGRPLSQIIGNHELYLYRQPLYIESADLNFRNDTTIDECVNKILKELQGENSCY